MASEESEETRMSVSLPEDLRGWLESEAESKDVDRDQLLAGLVAAYRTVTDDGDGAPEFQAGTPAGEVQSPVEERFESQHEEFMDLIEDVRRRVVQVKRETDAKAPEDHDHEALRETLETTQERCDKLEDDLVTVRETVDAVQGDLDAGFENYEDVLEHLVDEVDRLDDRLQLVARVAVDLRSEVQRQAKRETRRAEVEELKRAANQHGIRSAVCEECGESVEIALLTGPECPHCASTFSSLSPKQRFFGSHVLETGDPPALHGRVAGDDDSGDLDGLDRLADEAASADGNGTVEGQQPFEEVDDLDDGWTSAAQKRADQGSDSS